MFGTETSQITVEYRSQDAARLLTGLVVLEVFFATSHIFLFVWPGVSLETARAILGLDGETTLGTWFSTIQLFSIGAVLLLTSWANEREDRFPHDVFILIGLLFVYLSADEGGVIHERIEAYVKGSGLDSLLLTGNAGGWISIYAFMGLTFLFLLLYLTGNSLFRIWKLFTLECLFFICGFLVILIGGVGFETLFYIYLDSGTKMYHLETSIEEFLEMTGASITLYATLEIAATLCSEEFAQ